MSVPERDYLVRLRALPDSVPHYIGWTWARRRQRWIPVVSSNDLLEARQLLDVRGGGVVLRSGEQPECPPPDQPRFYRPPRR